MAIPATPVNFNVQTGNQRILLSWNLVPGATSYSIQRSTDGINFTVLGIATTNQYLDTTPLINVQYFYQVASVNISGTSPYTNPQSIVATLPGVITLGELRTRAFQKADRLGSQFVTMTEANFVINQSYYELYDMLIDVNEDYFIAPRATFVTDGVTQQYPIPNGQNFSGAPALYKLYGVDLGLDGSTNAWVTIKKFEFIQRNRYVYPQVTSTFLGVFNMRYRLIANTLMIIPTPSGQQTVGLWYFPRLVTLLQDTDSMDGFSGWEQYVICRTAKYILDKEESDTSVIKEELMYLKERIEGTAQNRDAGQGDCISQTRTRAEQWGGYGGPGYDGSGGGW